MKGLVIFLLVLVGIASFSFIVISAKNVNDIKTETLENPKALEFSTFTTAVCENKGNVVHCKDEFFVNCNGNVSIASDIAECDGVKIFHLDVPPCGSLVYDLPRLWTSFPNSYCLLGLP